MVSKSKLIFNMLLWVTVCLSADGEVFQDIMVNEPQPVRMNEQIDHQKQYIEKILLPQIRLISSHNAYLTYNAFIENEGTGYKPRRDINEYWQTVWGVGAKANNIEGPIPYAHLVAEKK